jgi:hypothetical protein
VSNANCSMQVRTSGVIGLASLCVPGNVHTILRGDASAFSTRPTTSWVLSSSRVPWMMRVGAVIFGRSASGEVVSPDRDSSTATCAYQGALCRTTETRSSYDENGDMRTSAAVALEAAR